MHKCILRLTRDQGGVLISFFFRLLHEIACLRLNEFMSLLLQTSKARRQMPCKSMEPRRDLNLLPPIGRILALVLTTCLVFLAITDVTRFTLWRRSLYGGGRSIPELDEIHRSESRSMEIGQDRDNRIDPAEHNRSFIVSYGYGRLGNQLLNFATLHSFQQELDVVPLLRSLQRDVLRYYFSPKKPFPRSVEESTKEISSRKRARISTYV